MLFGDLHHPRDMEIICPGERAGCGCGCVHGPEQSWEGRAAGGKEKAHGLIKAISVRLGVGIGCRTGNLGFISGLFSLNVKPLLISFHVNE